MKTSLLLCTILLADVALCQRDSTYKDLETAIQFPDSVYILDLSNQGLKRFPNELFIFPNLISLNLAENEIEFIPDSIDRLQTLEELRLGWFWGGNQISELPPSIGNLKNLKKLSLSNNKLKLIPNEIGKLNNLRELFIDFNELVVLPDQIGNLRKLERLGLAGNKLARLPSSLKNLKALKSLNLSQNNFSSAERTKVIKMLPKHCNIQF